MFLFSSYGKKLLRLYYEGKYSQLIKKLDEDIEDDEIEDDPEVSFYLEIRGAS